jgi:hypothetical protein
MTRKTAERKYRALVRTVVAEKGTNLFLAHQFLKLYPVLGIDGNWVFDDVQRVRRGDKMKPLPVVHFN